MRFNRKIKKLNTKKNIYKGNIGLNDMKRLTELAGELDLDLK